MNGRGSQNSSGLLDEGGAFRVVYAVQLAHEIRVVHAFQKKSKQDVKTPKQEIDLVRERLKKVKEALNER